MPTETESPWKEADITVGGVKLTPAQAMTVRVALAAFVIEMVGTVDPLGKDERGRQIAKNYVARANEVLELIMKGTK
jgi:hypothetical protein